ncbi:hypothetical protein [Amphiplicatus metriothermophilus]|uniref:AAA+ ATPase domain-containing protein n=1 Tax=Amphiplicatus metriothermophilus TaxID=1519374 RepID=A0A239PWU2_9PROT|nr:hypothetical protein [Amphiplicatus metriothermophilus]MBB5519593.1 chromosomal replication initiation ATPase DnaA [Amphiplicatus metriothermophilus]SNT74157.1 hypothetical protein SAMN06297382_2065 [Amphiplicatus metriothermophilus]
MTTQLALDFPSAPPRYRRADFIAAGAAASALAAADGFAASSEPALAICGPAGAGKTHLAHILAEALGRPVVALADAVGRPFAPGARLIADDADRGADPGEFLALVEAVRERGGRLVLAGRGDPRDWAGGLRDLETRLAAMARIVMPEPDEALLRAVMLKAFEDRQLRVSPGVVDYAAPRLPRTYAAARAFVEAAEEELKAAGRPINLGLARRAIARLF